MPRMRQSMPDEEKDELRKLLHAIEIMEELRKTMPLRYVKAFLLVALEEGEGVTEYAKQAGVALGVMSRHLLDIGDRNRHMKAGFGLVTQRTDPLELRKHQVMLTDKGKALAHRLARVLKTHA